MSMKIAAAVLAAMAVSVLQGETVDVPCGKTVQIERGRRFSGGTLVKTGGGVLDLTGAVLANEGLEIREGAVRFSMSSNVPVCTRHFRFNVTETRPGKSGPPEYARTGSQFSEFRFFLGGKPLALPKGTKAVGWRPGWIEGPGMAIDGNLKTKCYHNPLELDFGELFTFDGYTFVTANDAIGRDPRSWVVEAGLADGSLVNWSLAGEVKDFDAPKERFTEAGRIFPVKMCDVVPCGYPVRLSAGARLVLCGVVETMEGLSGGGLVVLEGGARLDVGRSREFTGSVVGDGTVCGW